MSDSIEFKVLGTLFGYALGGLLIVAGIFGYNKAPTQKQTREYFTKVISCKIQAGGSYNRNSCILELENHGTYSIYRASQDYSDLIKSIRKGDEVIVRLYGLKIYGIRKGDKEIYSFEEAHNKDVTLSIMLLIGGVVLVVLAKRYFNRD
ncbi:MAG: hypothetical protein UZ12_BCD005002418 [Bacteroidetes bacterium OLB12]|nr:MAG: hypothetical protein UZ12_BCD005002418 [Bacteroidetes bacterium OLB12]HNR72775.1 hypothetical protein [Cyclobacteriaceae bacterium]